MLLNSIIYYLRAAEGANCSRRDARVQFEPPEATRRREGS